MCICVCLCGFFFGFLTTGCRVFSLAIFLRNISAVNLKRNDATRTKTAARVQLRAAAAAPVLEPEAQRLLIEGSIVCVVESGRVFFS